MIQKVLKGLECCVADGERFDLCAKCPYRSQGGQPCNCKELDRDALKVIRELLKSNNGENHA